LKFQLHQGNNGNAGNLLVTVDQPFSLVCLDNTIASIDPVSFPESLEIYAQKVKSLLDDVIDAISHGAVTKQAEGVRQFLCRETSYDMGEAGCHHFQRGIADFIEASSKITVELLASLRERVIDAGRGADKNATEELLGMKAINIDYLQAVLAIFHACRS
jgi:hypothetical protein